MPRSPAASMRLRAEFSPRIKPLATVCRYSPTIIQWGLGQSGPVGGEPELANLFFYVFGAGAERWGDVLNLRLRSLTMAGMVL